MTWVLIAVLALAAYALGFRHGQRRAPVPPAVVERVRALSTASDARATKLQAAVDANRPTNTEKPR